MYRNRFRKRKKSLSEKFQIGLGRYCHDDEATSHHSNDLSFNSNQESLSKPVLPSENRKFCSTKDKLIVEKTDNISQKNNVILNGKFVHDVTFSQLSQSVMNEEIVSETKHIEIASTMEGASPKNNKETEGNDTKYVHDLQFSGVENLSHKDSSASPKCLDKISNECAKPHHDIGLESEDIICGSKSSKAKTISPKNRNKKERPNFVKLHAEYVSGWRKNRPFGETRPMRLIEYVFSCCNSDNGSDSESDDSFMIALKAAQKKEAARQESYFKN